MTSVVLDSEGLAALADAGSRLHHEVLALLRAAERLQRDVVIPTVVLAELYRGRGAVRWSMLASPGRPAWSCATRIGGSRMVGGVLVAAAASSEDMVDAHVVAVAVERGGAAVLTSDPGDHRRLTATYAGITVIALT